MHFLKFFNFSILIKHGISIFTWLRSQNSLSNFYNPIGVIVRAKATCIGSATHRILFRYIVSFNCTYVLSLGFASRKDKIVSLLPRAYFKRKSSHTTMINIYKTKRVRHCIVFLIYHYCMLLINTVPITRYQGYLYLSFFGNIDLVCGKPLEGKNYCKNVPPFSILYFRHYNYSNQGHGKSSQSWYIVEAR